MLHDWRPLFERMDWPCSGSWFRTRRLLTIHIVVRPPNQDLPLANVVRGANDPFLLHLLDQLGGLV